MVNSVSLYRGVSHAITIAMAQLVSVVRVFGKIRIVNVIQSQLVTIRTSFGKLINIVMAQSISMRRSLTKFISIIIINNLSVIRAIPRRIIVTGMAQFIRLFTSAHALNFRTIIVHTGQVVTWFYSTFIKPIRRITSGRTDSTVSQRSRQEFPHRPTVLSTGDYAGMIDLTNKERQVSVADWLVNWQLSRQNQPQGSGGRK
jgi:hypothetical protein